jgi:hypothetical protein
MWAGYGAPKSANQGADGVLLIGTRQREVRKRECPAALRSLRPQARIETPGARTERPGHCPGWKAADRWEKAMSYKSHMHGDGESYSGIVCAEQRVVQEG